MAPNKAKKLSREEVLLRKKESERIRRENIRCYISHSRVTPILKKIMTHEADIIKEDPFGYVFGSTSPSTSQKKNGKNNKIEMVKFDIKMFHLM